MTNILARLAFWTGVTALVLAAAGQIPARDGATADSGSGAGHPGPLDQELDALYSTRLLFSPAGVPQVTIGVMEGAASASLTIEGGGLVAWYEGDLKTRAVADGAALKVDLADYTPAVLRYWVVIKRLSWRERDLAGKFLATWREREKDVSLRTVGGVQGLGGVLVDTRQTMVAAGPFDDPEAAKTCADRLFSTYGLRADTLEDVVKRPSALLEVSVDGVKLARGRDLVWVMPGSNGAVKVWRPSRGNSYERPSPPAWRRYAGRMYAAADSHGGFCVAQMGDMETVINGTVPSEIFMSAPIEAIKAQAVAARNQLLVSLGTRHLADPFALCDTQHCQVYGGLDASHPKARQAVEETRGQLLFDDRGLVNTYYSAMAGGFTENNETQWPGNADQSLRGVYDGPGPSPPGVFAKGITEALIREWIFSPPADLYPLYTKANRKFFRWKRDFDHLRLNELVAQRYPDLGVVKDLSVLQRGVSGRVTALQIQGSRRTVVEQKPYDIRVMLDNLPSAMFVVEVERGDDGMPRRFTFHGGGWGHGVGMCQTGAMGMATAGSSFTEILTHYYQGSSLKTLY